MQALPNSWLRKVLRRRRLKALVTAGDVTCDCLSAELDRGSLHGGRVSRGVGLMSSSDVLLKFTKV